MTTTTTISHEIAERLRDDILQGRYAQDDRLPSERDLAVRFDTSRGAVREALSQLEQLGLIRIQPGGARVQPIDKASLSILGPLMAMEYPANATLVDQFMQTFAALAALTGRSAIETADEAQLNRMREMLVELACHTGDFTELEPYWRKFYEYLSETADNLVVRLIGNDLKAQFVDQMMKLNLQPQVDQRQMQQLIARLQVAVNEVDGVAAAAAIQNHFDAMRQAIVSALTDSTEKYKQQAVV